MWQKYKQHMTTNYTVYGKKLDNILQIIQQTWKQVRQHVMFAEQHITFKFGLLRHTGTIMCYSLSIYLYTSHEWINKDSFHFLPNLKDLKQLPRVLSYICLDFMSSMTDKFVL